MDIRTYDYKLEKALKQCTSGLIISFNTEVEAQTAAEEVGKQYECILYVTESGKYYNVFVPATKNGIKIFDYQVAYDLGKEITTKYCGNGFVTDFTENGPLIRNKTALPRTKLWEQ